MAGKCPDNDMSDSDSGNERAITIPVVNEVRLVVTKEQYSLLKAVEGEDVTAILRFFRTGGNLNIQFNHGATLLQVAIENKKLTALTAILALGANPDKKGIRLYRHLGEDILPRLYTPMETAAILDQPDAIRILFEYGANPHIVGEDGESALSLALRYGCESCVLLLRGFPAPQIPCTEAQHRLMNAVHYSNEDELIYLLTEKIDPNFAIPDGPSPLFLAIENDFYNCFKLLLDYGANPNMMCKRIYICEDLPDSDRPRMWTPLESAVVYELTEYMALLIGYGANVYYSDIEGKSALQTAYDYQRLTAIQFLENYIANVRGPRGNELLFSELNKEEKTPYDCTIEPQYFSEEPGQSKSMTTPSGTHNWELYDPWMDVDSGYLEQSPDSSVTQKCEPSYQYIYDSLMDPQSNQKVTTTSNKRKYETGEEPVCSFFYVPTSKVTSVGSYRSNKEEDPQPHCSYRYVDNPESNQEIPQFIYRYVHTSESDEEELPPSSSKGMHKGIYGFSEGEPDSSCEYTSIPEGTDTETKGKSGKGIKRKKIGKYLKQQDVDRSEKEKNDETYDQSGQTDGEKDLPKEDPTDTQKETGNDKTLKTKNADDGKKDEQKITLISDTQRKKQDDEKCEVVREKCPSENTGIETEKEDPKVKPKPAHQGARLNPDYEEEDWFIEGAWDTDEENEQEDDDVEEEVVLDDDDSNNGKQDV